MLATGIALAAQAAAQAEMKGSLVIIGGSLRFGDKEVWSRIVQLAGGEGPRIAVFPTASDEPQKEGQRVVEVFQSLGARPFVVPVAVQKAERDYREAAADPALVAAVAEADGVFFIGGEQARITRALYTEEGQNTPVLDAVWQVYRRGGVIAGTSAGAAIMSRVMCRDAPNVLHTLLHGVTMGREIDRGLGFVDQSWFVEQHTLTRGRFARALAIMHSQGFKYGIGVDDNTALVIRNGKDLEVIGYKGALVMDLSEARQNPEISGFNLKNVKLTYIDHGDSFNLQTLELSPSPLKHADRKIDPNHESFLPYYKDNLFFNDILANTTVTDLLAKLLEHTTGEAIGLAFDGFRARNEPTRGFEFRFYRDKDTVGWHTDARGGEDYTIANVHLDIRPIEIVAPLYK
jgi:cyanophycinase